MTHADGPVSSYSRRLTTLSLAGLMALAGCGGADGEAAFVAADPEAGYVVPLKKSDPTFTLSSLYLRHPGQEIRVLEVRALTSPNVQYVGAVNVWPSDYRTTPLSVGPGYPAPELRVHHPIDEAVPATATNLTPMPGVVEAPPLAVAAGFRVVSGDLGAVNGVRVVYTANGKKFTEDFRQTVIVCIKPRPCEEPTGTNFSTWQDGILRQFGLLPEDD